MIEKMSVLSSNFSGESLSLYFHIPFCKSRCGYCDFYSLASDNTSEFVETLIREMELYIELNSTLSKASIDTIFFGGGTPSMLDVESWVRVGESLNRLFDLSTCREWSVEVNPESFSNEKAQAWLDMGVTRLSFGVQSLDDTLLKSIGRVHTSGDVKTLLSNPILERFNSISCDFIYALPSQTVEQVISTIDEVLEFGVVKHLSAYELTIAEGTPFSRLSADKFPTEESIIELESRVVEQIEGAGFRRYEVSNYAKEGYHSLHNSHYWSLHNYLGFGPSAHSFIGGERFSNYPSLKRYSSLINGGKLPIESTERVSQFELGEEYLFLGLRTAIGVSSQAFKGYFGEELYSDIRVEVIDELVKEGRATYNGEEFKLTSKGLTIADGVAVRLTPEE